MLRRRLRRWLAIASLSLTTSQAGAWGPLPHRAIALIAQDRLSPRALGAVRDILGDGVGLDQIANCADSILHTQEPLNCGGAFMLQGDPSKKTGRWHYINIPVTAPVTAGSVMNYCPNGKDCVVEQIRRQAHVLGDKAASREERRSALMFLVHFVGDEHQPLHCGDDRDFGGNNKPVVFQGKAKNLHSLWDSMIRAQEWQEDLALDPAPLARELESGMGEENPGAWTVGDFVTETALESAAIARDAIYPQYAKDRGQNLGDAYQKQMQPIVKRRMAMAGVRLAAILERALGSGSAARFD